MRNKVKSAAANRGRGGRIFKKLALVFLGFILVISLWPTKAVGESVGDQYCSLTDDSYNLYLHLHTGVEQTFVPTLNRLNQVALTFSAVNDGGTVVMRIRKGDQTITGDSRSIIAGSKQLYYFNTFPEVEVTPGETYKITVSVSGTETFVWHASGAYSGCYANGEGYADDVPLGAGRDFNFSTFGYNASSPTPTPSQSLSPSSSPQPGVDTTTNYGAQPWANVSKEIKPPTEVKAENKSTETVLEAKINWTKSATENIEGYKVFRKEEGKEYGQVAQAEKTIVEFVDTQVLDQIKYTYMVRAYKGNLESENSNEANVSVSKEKKKSTFSIPILGIDIGWKTPIFLGFFIAAAIAILGLILWYWLHRRQQQRMKMAKKKL